MEGNTAKSKMMDCELCKPASVVAETALVLALLNEAQRRIQTQEAPDGYNIDVNIGAGGIRCVLRSR